MLGKKKKKIQLFQLESHSTAQLNWALFLFHEDRVELHRNRLQNQHKKLFIFLLSLKYVHNITEVLMLWILHVFNEKMGM